MFTSSYQSGVLATLVMSLPVGEVVAAARSCTTCKGPVHSWDHIPLSLHWATPETQSDGSFSAQDLQTVEKFPLVTIEKWQGSGAANFLWEEDAWVAAAKQIKGANPNASVVVWMDTMLVYTGWNTTGTDVNHTLNPDADPNCATGHFRNAEFLEAPANQGTYLAKNSSSMFALESWSHCHVYDHANPLVRQYWTDMCLNMTASGYIDGCGADFSAMEQNNWEAHTTQNIMKQLGMDNETAAAWGAGHRQMMLDTTTALGDGVLVAKDWRELGDHANGVIQEQCPPANGTIVILQNLTAQAKQLGKRLVYQCHTSNLEQSLPAFLIGAGVDHYIVFGGWSGGPAAGHWSPLADLPLGEPLADGVYDPATGNWTRSFKSGTTVSFDPVARSGTVHWSTGHVTRS